MKIVFIVMRLGKDGLATNIRDLAQGMVKRGHELHIITSGFKIKEASDNSFFDELKSSFQSLGIVIHYFKEPKGNPVKKGIASLSGLFRISLLLRKIDPDVIHCHSPNLTFIPYLLGRKYVSTVHADTIRPNMRYKHPTLLIAVSEGSKEFTKRVMGSPESSIRMVYHGISERFAVQEDKANLERLKTEFKIPQDKFLIGVVGRITPQKGTDILVEALGKFLPAKILDQVHVIIVGDYQSESQKVWLDAMLREHQLSDKFSVLGFRDPKPFYQLFDVFVLPSRSDTFGLVAVESMMSGCCTIRSNANGAYDQIDPGVDGLIFEMDNAQELALHLENVFLDGAFRSKLAQNGKQKALANFTVAKMVDNTLEIYKELERM
ncbi:glycosyltransferase family 4 protein [Maribacter flavus]|uniref:Glycosyltransferase family 4 protein n=1 Tax=Maribacter flavus TaxID=1658664 RepID=A0A5B2TTU3_9FLAO|nr:glycosyltransferase family 4 protein [Maribacter flavus]KAA2217468.1 glycosyltransferase family 4 protein [Maribacter flavus]